MRNLKLAVFASLAAVAVSASLALGAGMFSGYPAATNPLTGTETIPADTGLSAGRAPQTELVTPDNLKNYVLGGYATPSGTATAAGTTTATATLNAGRGKITSAALTTAAAAHYTLTLTNAAVAATSIVLVSVGYGTSTTGSPTVANVTPGAGSVVIDVENNHASAALNGTIVVSFVVVN